MLPPIAVLSPQKLALRERMKAVRRSAAAARPEAAIHAAANFMRTIKTRPGAIVALYHPLKDELDTLPLAAALREEGASLALPAADRRGAPLIMRRWTLDAPLAKGRYGAMAPKDAPAVRPEIVVVPLLAFDRQGRRLGYGGGYYDRTLAELRRTGAVLAVGYAYGAQEVDAVPAGALDERLDFVVTEREAARIGNAAAFAGTGS